MNRRNFIKSLAMAAAGVLSGAQLVGEPRKRYDNTIRPQRERIRRLYELTDDGYLEIWGQSSFPIYGATGNVTGDCMRLRAA